jgi:hypothetical protein
MFEENVPLKTDNYRTKVCYVGIGLGLMTGVLTIVGVYLLQTNSKTDVPVESHTTIENCNVSFSAISQDKPVRCDLKLLANLSLPYIKEAGVSGSSYTSAGESLAVVATMINDDFHRIYSNFSEFCIQETIFQYMCSGVANQTLCEQVYNDSALLLSRLSHIHTITYVFDYNSGRDIGGEFPALTIGNNIARINELPSNISPNNQESILTQLLGFLLVSESPLCF